MLNNFDEKIFTLKENKEWTRTGKAERQMVTTDMQFANREIPNYDVDESQFDEKLIKGSGIEQFEIDADYNRSVKAHDIKKIEKTSEPIKSGRKLAYEIMKLNGVWYAFRKRGNAISGYPSFSCEVLNVVITWCADHDKGHYNAYFRKESNLERLFAN